MTPARRLRLDALDLLRGAVMVLMALDHARDFFSSAHFEPTDLGRTTAALFFTRWITHFCAPVFCFLAGTGAYLSSKSPRELSRFLVTRGLWLVLLDLTVVHVGFFGPQYERVPLITLWMLGWCMVVLGGLVHLPVRAVGAIGLAMIAGHNLLDGLHGGGALWQLLHDGGRLSPHVFVGYPLLPWPGVMAAGYAFGAVIKLPEEERRRWLTRLGAAATVAFLILRAVNRYGDPRPWEPQASPLFTALSFLDCRKYPPSLDYLLMTLGPSLLALRALDGVRVRDDHPLRIFGRVPMFYYLLHLYVLRLGATVYFALVEGTFSLSLPPGSPAPPEHGIGLPGVYVAWMITTVVLYPACRWYARLKQRSANPWLSYL